jgi:manganese transport protein
VRYAYWAQAQVVAIATDVAEIIGGAIALNLLVGLNLVAGAVLTGAFSVAHLSLREKGKHRMFEAVVLFLIAITAVGFTAGVFVAPLDRAAIFQGLIPSFQGKESLLLGVSIFGATIMPHAIYAHSALSRDRFFSAAEGRSIRDVLVATRWDVSLAMLLAGFVNVGIFLVGAIHLFGHNIENSIVGAHSAISATLGVGFGLMFAVGLLASGIASSSVGTYASTVINQGLLKVCTSLVVQRLVAIVPAIILISISPNPTMSLVMSQVVLSLGIPFALFPLVILTSKKSLMSCYTNGVPMRILSGALAVFLTALNVALLALVFFN